VAESSRALGDRLAPLGPARAFSLVLPHVIHLSTGDWLAAVEGLALAARDEPDPHYRLHPHLERAVGMARLDPDRAAEAVHTDVELALASVAKAGCRRCESECLTRGAEALARIGDLEQSAMLLARFRARPRLAANHIMAWRELRADASLAAATGDTRAAGLLDEVITAAATQGLRLEAVWAQIDLARVLSGADRDRSTQLLRSAGAAAERMGAKTEAAVAERGLRALGVRTWRRGPVRAGPERISLLTDREREIARLASGGASNPDIAAALFLSRKTVERHISNAMAKLGVQNRAELAGLLSKSGPQE
jgi:DNA-binding CsgD family transcriptional regulator